MERTIQDKFELTAAEIDRCVGETEELLATEKIDPKDALRLRFMLDAIGSDAQRQTDTIRSRIIERKQPHMLLPI